MPSEALKAQTAAVLTLPREIALLLLLSFVFQLYV
jgi:hypothetical protein